MKLAKNITASFAVGIALVAFAGTGIMGATLGMCALCLLGAS